MEVKQEEIQILRKTVENISQTVFESAIVGKCIWFYKNEVLKLVEEDKPGISKSDAVLIYTLVEQLVLYGFAAVVVTPKSRRRVIRMPREDLSVISDPVTHEKKLSIGGALEFVKREGEVKIEFVHDGSFDFDHVRICKPTESLINACVMIKSELRNRAAITDRNATRPLFRVPRESDSHSLELRMNEHAAMTMHMIAFGERLRKEKDEIKKLRKAGRDLENSETSNYKARAKLDSLAKKDPMNMSLITNIDMPHPDYSSLNDLVHEQSGVTIAAAPETRFPTGAPEVIAIHESVIYSYFNLSAITVNRTELSEMTRAAHAQAKRLTSVVMGVFNDLFNEPSSIKQTDCKVLKDLPHRTRMELYLANVITREAVAEAHDIPKKYIAKDDPNCMARQNRPNILGTDTSSGDTEPQAKRSKSGRQVYPGGPSMF